MTGTLPAFEVVAQGGTNVVEYIHVERTSSLSGIDYTVQQVPNLVYGTWTNTGFAVVGESGEVDGFKTVTNQASAAAAEKFVRLLIEEQ